MAEIQNNKPTQTNKVRAPCFLACFGVSDEVFRKEQDSGDTTLKNKRKKNTGWFSWSRYRMKKSGAKTVPAETIVPELPKLNNKIHGSKSKSRYKFFPKRHRPVGNLEVIPTIAPILKPIEINGGSEQEITQENREKPITTKQETCRTPESFCRKVESIRTALSQPGSPESKPKTPRSKLVSRTASFPDRNGTKPAAAIQVRPLVKNPIDETDPVREKYDPILGLSIVLVTLIIILVWGRLCAILCTSAWFYFLPRFRITGKSESSDRVIQNGSNWTDSDLNSELYKKKVVMEGFLSRSHQSPS